MFIHEIWILNGLGYDNCRVAMRSGCHLKFNGPIDLWDYAGYRLYAIGNLILIRCRTSFVACIPVMLISESRRMSEPNFNSVLVFQWYSLSILWILILLSINIDRFSLRSVLHTLFYHFVTFSRVLYERDFPNWFVFVVWKSDVDLFENWQDTQVVDTWKDIIYIWFGLNSYFF